VISKETHNRQICMRKYGQMRWIEIAPSPNAETSIILHDKYFVAKMYPGLNLGIPSLMFFTENLEELHTNLSDKNIKMGEVVGIATGSDGKKIGFY
jgi:lactoylglutathione lyase